jgi:predicted DNA-binding antitoxin AbrB/MazE fold protein
MASIVHAIYEKGVFRPVEPVDLPDHTPVEFEPRVLAEVPQSPAPSMSEGLAKIYEILGRRYRSGHTDTAARHNEHQP